MNAVDEDITIAKCRDSHTWITEDQGANCPSCGGKWVSMRYTTRASVRSDILRHKGRSEMPCPNIGIFKPYKEDGFNGENILIETKQQRDALCAEHGVTYDQYSNIKPPTVVPAIDSINPGELKAALDNPDFLTEGLDDYEPDLPEANTNENEDAS